MTTFVIDSSSSLKCVLKDEDNYKIAQQILAEYLSGKINLISPNIWIYEVANGLRSAYLSKRISFIKSKQLLDKILLAKPDTYFVETFIKQCFEISEKYQISVYDGLYVFLALNNKIPLI